jgi:hypothetical protein
MTSFTQDLFISYAHIDNQAMTADEKGWVSRFHSTLERMLSVNMGKNVRIWRDDKLQGNDMFADEITDQFAQTAVLISVLTPCYINSDWCTKEVDEFYKTAQQYGGITIDNKSRIFKVVKIPVDTQESLPLEMKNALGYEFFMMEDGVPTVLDAMYGLSYAEAYKKKVNILSWHIAELLKKIEAGLGDNSPQEEAKGTVYLAECSHNLKEVRELLESDLQHHGYTVLPDRQLPRDEADYVTAVQSLLERSTLSIHLVGKTYGAVPDGPSEKSVVVLQNTLAVQRSKSDTLERLIWLPEGTNSEHSRQQAFITALHQDENIQYGADLITGDVETLKASVHATLKKLEKLDATTLATPDEGEDGNKLIYLICNERDVKATVAVRKFLRNAGFNITTPIFEGDAGVVREAHQQSMKECDAVIIFYGSGDEGWKHTLDNELKKLPVYRGDKPLLGCYTYLAQPSTAKKVDLIDMEEDKLIDGLEAFSATAMTDFMQVISSAAKA